MTGEQQMDYGDDPAEFGVDQVNAYVARLDPEDDEYLRVLAAEENGKARVSILGKDEPAADGEQPTLVAVELRHHWTDADGKAHAPGESVRVPQSVADQLRNSTYAVAEAADA